MRRLTALGAAVLLTAGCSSPDDGAMPLGFSRASVEAQRALQLGNRVRQASGRKQGLSMLERMSGATRMQGCGLARGV